MNNDETEALRLELLKVVEKNAGDRAKLEERYGKVWDTKELQEEFNVTGFAAPFVAVTRKSDGRSGALMFQHLPRFYFDFRPI